MPRILVAVTTRDGDVDVTNIGRPAALVAFGDKYGKSIPDEYAEIAWLTHRALGIEQPLDEWLETLEELTANDAEVEAAQREQAGKLLAHERLSKMSGEELVALLDVDGTKLTPELAALVLEAKQSLDELEARRQAELDEAKAAAEGAGEAEPDPTHAASTAGAGG